MAKAPDDKTDTTEVFADLLRSQTEIVTGLFGELMPKQGQGDANSSEFQWAEVVETLQNMWSGFQAEQAG